MSAAQSPTLESKLEALQCHFTWGLDPSRSKLLHLRYKLEDIGTEEGNSWLGHIYNLRGFVQLKLRFTDDAQSLFNKAAEAFRQMRNTVSGEGPWLVVNYGNLAWLHHQLGERAESQAYLSKVDSLMDEYPSPSQDELHPEIYAEKAWTLMKFGADEKLLAADCFQRAIGMQPNMVEWNTSHVLGLMSAFRHSNTGLEADLLEKMRIARERDPENLYLAVHYLEQRLKKGEKVEDEARELAKKVMRNPVSSYSGMKALLWVYIIYISVDEAIDLAEEALKKYPDVHYVKNCVELCYKWIVSFRVSHSEKSLVDRSIRPEKSLVDRAISLHEEGIALYPHSSILKKIDLANIYAKNNYQAKAEQIYQELLESEVEPADEQMIYNRYANYLFFDRHDQNESIRYHKKVLEIPQQSSFRENSIKVLLKPEVGPECVDK